MTIQDTTESGESRIEPNTGSVLLVTPWYRPTVGGVVEVTDRLLRLLKSAGVETYLLVCDSENGNYGVKADQSLANVWNINIPSSAFSRLRLKTIMGTLIRGCGVFWQLLRFLQTHEVRTIILIYTTESGWPFLILRYALRLRLIVSLHGNDIIKYSDYTRLWRWFLRGLLWNAEYIIVCGDHLAQEVKKILSGAQLPIRLIPNCVNSEHFVLPPLGYRKPEDPPTLVHVSNFAPKKRTLDIIEAFANSAIPQDARLIMVGDGHDLKATIEHARNLRVDDRVEFVGAQKDVRPYLWQADLFVLASDSEGDPLVLLEAMASGLPWVSTGWGAAASLPPGECGLVVPFRSPHELAAAIAKLIRDPERLRAMGRRGRYRAEVDFGEGKYLESHLRLIRGDE